MRFIFIIILTVFILGSCASDDDTNGPNNEITEFLGTVNFKTDGRSYSLKVYRALIRHGDNDPEEGTLVFMAVNCDEPLKSHFEMIPELGEQDVDLHSTIHFNWYDQTNCPFDRDQLDNIVTTEFFSTGTSNLTEMGVRYKGTFSGKTVLVSGAQGHEITDGRFDFKLDDEY